MAKQTMAAFDPKKMLPPSASPVAKALIVYAVVMLIAATVFEVVGLVMLYLPGRWWQGWTYLGLGVSLDSVGGLFLGLGCILREQRLTRQDSWRIAYQLRQEIKGTS